MIRPRWRNYVNDQQVTLSRIQVVEIVSFSSILNCYAKRIISQPLKIMFGEHLVNKLILNFLLNS